MRGWGLNLATIPRETLYQLQDGVTTELRAREGHTLHILIEHRTNLETLILQHDDLVTHSKELEQDVAEVYSTVRKLVVPLKLPIADKIHHMAASFHTAQEEATKAR